jgi:hypothetical protein
MYKMVITDTKTGEVIKELTGDAVIAAVGTKENIFSKATCCFVMKARTPADVLAIRRHVSRLKTECVKKAMGMCEGKAMHEQLVTNITLGCKSDDAHELVQSGFATKEQGKAMQDSIMKELFDTDPIAKKLAGLLGINPFASNDLEEQIDAPDPDNILNMFGGLKP